MFETETRDLTLMVIKANSLKMQQQNICHIAKYQDNKNHPKLCANGQILQTVHFHFPLRNLQPQTCGLIYNFHEEMHGH